MLKVILLLQVSSHDFEPLQPDRCDQINVIYQADVHAENKIMKYYGSTERQFKKSHTTLSSHIWKLKDKGTPYEVKWSIKVRVHAFSSGGRACDMCLTEKLIILTADQNRMLNKRDELLETCRHQRKHLLVSLLERKKKKPPNTAIK